MWLRREREQRNERPRGGTKNVRYEGNSVGRIGSNFRLYRGGKKGGWKNTKRARGTARRSAMANEKGRLWIRDKRKKRITITRLVFADVYGLSPLANKPSRIRAKWISVETFPTIFPGPEWRSMAKVTTSVREWGRKRRMKFPCYESG